MAQGARDHEKVSAFTRPPGSVDQQNITANSAGVTVTFAATSISMIIQNLSGQFIQFSFDSGTTFTTLNPYQAFEMNVSVADVLIRRKSGSDDAEVQVIVTHGKA